MTGLITTGQPSSSAFDGTSASVYATRNAVPGRSAAAARRFMRYLLANRFAVSKSSPGRPK